MNFLQSTWSFKFNFFPDGKIHNFKAIFFVRSDQHIEGVYFFQNIAPVAKWTTMRLMMVILIILGLVTAHADITTALLHAYMEEVGDIYVEIPCGSFRNRKI